MTLAIAMAGALIVFPCVLVWMTLQIVPNLPEPGKKRR